jgi:hypothetical protein
MSQEITSRATKLIELCNAVSTAAADTVRFQRDRESVETLETGLNDLAALINIMGDAGDISLENCDYDLGDKITLIADELLKDTASCMPVWSPVEPSLGEAEITASRYGHDS